MIFDALKLNQYIPVFLGNVKTVNRELLYHTKCHNWPRWKDRRKIDAKHTYSYTSHLNAVPLVPSVTMSIYLLRNPDRAHAHARTNAHGSVPDLLPSPLELVQQCGHLPCTGAA